MFRIGEFAQIAQVSARLLRHYDQLGLLKPARSDPETGYRFYGIRQLPRLNRILALKELGLTLEQIAPLLDREVSPTELRGMLMMKRAQIEQSLSEDEARLRRVESRIAQIDRGGAIGDYDVVVKAVAEAPFLSLRSLCDGMEAAFALVKAVAAEGARKIRPTLRDKLVVVARNDGPASEADERLDLEIGFTLARPTNQSVAVAENLVLTASTLPAVATMATVVRSVADEQSHQAFAAIGGWIEANGYAVAGPCREVFLELPTGPPGPEGPLLEIQFPLRPAA